MNKTHCLTPVQLTEYAFAAAQGDPIPAEVDNHLAQCQTCADTAKQYLRLVRRLNASASGKAEYAEKAADCLDENTVAAFVDGTLPPKFRTATESHLACCSRCRREIAETWEIVQAASPPPRPNLARYIVALAHDAINLISPPQGLLQQPRPAAAMLGPGAQNAPDSSSIVQWETQAGGFNLRFTVTRLDKRRVKLGAEIAANDSDNRSIQFTLRREDLIVHSEPVPKSGRVLITGLRTGIYTISLQLEDDAPVSIVLELQPA